MNCDFDQIACVETFRVVWKNVNVAKKKTFHESTNDGGSAFKGNNKYRHLLTSFDLCVCVCLFSLSLYSYNLYLRTACFKQCCLYQRSISKWNAQMDWAMCFVPLMCLTSKFATFMTLNHLKNRGIYILWVSENYKSQWAFIQQESAIIKIEILKEENKNGMRKKTHTHTSWVLFTWDDSK